MCAKAADFTFAYADTMHVALAKADRRTLAQMMEARGTGRPERILARIRDAVVRPFGLKPIGPTGMAPFDRRSDGADVTVMGVDDRHVDVRIVYQLEGPSEARRLYATTLVRAHNTWGKAYLATILPIHFLVVKRQLERIATAQSAPAP